MVLLRSWNAGMAMAVVARSIHVARAFSSSAAPAELGARTKAADWDADRYTKNAAFVPELGKNVLDLLEPKSGERILDVGCGDGVLTAELKARGCKVVGIDFASNMVAAAVKREVEAYVMDASAIDAPFLLSKISHHNNNNNNNNSPSGISSSSPTTATAETPAIPKGGVSPQCGGESGRAPPVPADGTADDPSAFDAVFTNAALHWVRAPRTVIDGAKRVLRPGGRFVGEFGGHGNMAAVRVAMHAALWRRGLDPLEVDPWYFPTAEEYRRLLEAAGFIVDYVALIPRPTVLPSGTGMRGWLSTFTQAFLNALPDNSSTESTAAGNNAVDEHGLTRAKANVVDEALASLQPALCDKDGAWTADYVRLRFKAHLPCDYAGGTALDTAGSGGGGERGVGGRIAKRDRLV